jgi:type II secretory pathway component PulK
MPFTPGKSGNKSGRPRGAKDKRRELRERLEGRATEVLDAALRAALELGDMSMLGKLLDKLLPPARPEAVPLKLGGDTLTDKASAVLAAMASGQLAPEEAQRVLSGLAQVAKIAELDIITQRLDALEARLLEDKKP